MRHRRCTCTPVRGVIGPGRVEMQPFRPKAPPVSAR
jgi:hypothetical protein